MKFYGLVAQNENPYNPFLKFEAENIKEVLEYTEEARKHDATLLTYKGYKRTTKTNQTIYCIQEIVKELKPGNISI